MSELSKLTKREAQLRVWLAEPAEPSEAHIRELSKGREELDEMNLRAEKLLLKMKEKDAITGEARYGPAAVTKIQTLNDNVKNLMAEFGRTFEDRSAGVVITPVDEKEKTPVLSADNIFDLNGTFVESYRKDLDEEKTTMQRQEEIENSIIDPLANEKAVLKQSLRSFNDAATGPDAFSVILKELRVKDSIDKNAFKFISGIIENVVSYPDDEKLRLIRLNHPVIFEKMAKHRGCIKLMCAAGFRLQCLPPDAPPLSPSGSGDSGAANIYAAKAVPQVPPTNTMSDEPDLPLDQCEDPEVATFLQAASDVRLIPSLYLKEPSVEDTTGWVAWFDSISSIRNLCSQ